MQVRIAGTKVINCHLVSRLAKRLNNRRHFRHINKSALSHFNLYLLRKH
ncbi:Uncharacterised protein [Salmonella enterica subsp. enterica serovar Bovismorbificans]|uniref:Uncharacterized protein n=1 Tax=Salmonella enterica subsp. enterica serovar Bovismorbificans TaxID=58097 RepID=A0A655EIR6_SALET|nr:Uncharacterised protein [Salmonella enterica subsp. enterica serovar Bovismorbificans]